MTDQLFVIIIILVSILGVLGLVGLVARTLNRHLDRRQELQKLRAGPGTSELEGRVEELHDHVVQLEERVDFAERLLTQSRERGLVEPDRDREGV